MLRSWLTMVRRKGRLDSPVGYVKANIFFTFVLSWINLPKFWKTLQLLNPTFLLLIKGSLLTLPRLVKRLTWIHLLPILIFLSLTVLCLFPTNHWSKRASAWFHHQLFIPEEHNDHTAHVLLISSDSHESKDGPLVLAA